MAIFDRHAAGHRHFARSRGGKRQPVRFCAHCQRKIRISFSVGCAEIPVGESDLEETIARADKRMYLHKQSRNAGRPIQPGRLISEPGAKGEAFIPGDRSASETQLQTDARVQLRHLADESRRKGYVAEDRQGGDEAGVSIADDLPRAQRRN